MEVEGGRDRWYNLCGNIYGPQAHWEKLKVQANTDIEPTEKKYDNVSRGKHNSFTLKQIFQKL